MITRDELRERVRAKLAANGAHRDVIDRVLRPGFFTSASGLETLGRALGVLAVDEEVES